jgi:hypothetical protein
MKYKLDKKAKKFRKQYGAKYPLVNQGFGYEIQALTPPEIRSLIEDEIKTVMDEL